MFGEKEKEYSKKQGKEIPVWQSPKYIEAKEKAKELIESKKYDLTEGDFWILMNETKNGSMGYTGLIISHNGCLKINDKLENKVEPEGFEYDNNGYKSSLIFTYRDDELFEVGEVSATNCKNDYPYAMALKRCFDRVVLKKCKLAYAGIYSDSEASEFEKKEDEEINNKISETMVTSLTNAIRNKEYTRKFVQDILTKYGYKELAEIEIEKLPDIKKELDI